MGKYLEKFKHGVKKIDNKIKNISEEEFYDEETKNYPNSPNDDFYDELNNLPRNKQFKKKGNQEHNPFNNYLDNFDDVGIQQAQKPESFHHFILENQYRELEKSIRGFKDVFDKQTQQWRTIRKAEHCFTDEEAEEIVGTAQSHLATDIKLSYINRDSFPILMDAIYQEVAFLFESIAEYRYGRYGSFEKQYSMKLQNHKIFLELFTRIQANYSRAIGGQENKATHESVRGQESLQQTDRFSDRRMGNQY